MKSVRLRDIQNITITEAELNSLSGLTANSSELNKLDGFTGTTSDLNSMIGVGDDFANHIALDAASAHTIAANSIDGLAIVDNTITQSKLAFNVATPADITAVENDLADLRADHDALANDLNILTGIVIPGQGADILDSIAQTVAHIGMISDAHDASAISYGETESGYYYILSNYLVASTSLHVGTNRTRFFRVGDNISIESNTESAFATTVNAVNHSTGIITTSTSPSVNYNTLDQARVTNANENEVQASVTRSLRNATDKLAGRLTIENSETGLDALVIDKVGTGYDLKFSNQANIISGSGFTFNLASGFQDFLIKDNTAISIFGINQSGDSFSGTHTLKDFSSGFEGAIDKDPLTADRVWTFPDKSGEIALDSDLINVYDSVADMAALAAITDMEEGDIALVADADGFGNPGSFVYTGSSWQQLGSSASGTGAVLVDFVDPVSTTLPTGVSVTIDGVAGADDDLVLFTNLSSNNNRIYKLGGVGVSITWTPQSLYSTGVDPADGEAVRARDGESFAESLGVFNGASFAFNDVVRYFSGADYWEQSSLKTSSIADNTTDNIFTVTLAGSENMIIDFSLARGSSKEAGQFVINSDGSIVDYTKTSSVIGTTGVLLFADVSGANVRFRYTSDNSGSSGQIKYSVKRWSNASGGPGGIPSYSGSGGGSVTAAGSLGDVQFHGVGDVLDAVSEFNWDDSNKELNLDGLRIASLAGPLTLNDNVSPAATLFTINQTLFKFVIIEYSVTRGTESRIGHLRICHNGTVANYSDDFVDTGGAGIGLGEVTFTADLSGGNIRVRYTTTNTGNSGSFKYSVRKWL